MLETRIFHVRDSNLQENVALARERAERGGVSEGAGESEGVRGSGRVREGAGERRRRQGGRREGSKKGSESEGRKRGAGGRIRSRPGARITDGEG